MNLNVNKSIFQNLVICTNVHHQIHKCIPFSKTTKSLFSNNIIDDSMTIYFREHY